MPSKTIAAIQSLIPKSVASVPWWERHAEGNERMLAEILDAWRAGHFGTKRKSAARGISAYLTANGIPIG